MLLLDTNIRNAITSVMQRKGYVPAPEGTVPDLRIAPDGAATLKPGGLHLMLMDGKGALKEGQTVPLRLQMEGGDEANATLTVRKAAK